MDLPKYLNVTRDDVLRVIARDFPAHERRHILAVLDQCPDEYWQDARDRVHLAILRLSGGSVEKLQQHVRAVQCDTLDVLRSVEHPFLLQATLGRVAPLSRIEAEQLLERDYRQYIAWLNAEHVDFGNDLRLVCPPSRVKRERGFPGWAGPFVGPLVGIAVAAVAPVDPQNTSRHLGIMVGAILGFLSGLVVWFMDRGLRRKIHPDP